MSKLIPSEKLQKMRGAAPLLPDPGPEVLIEVLDHIAEMESDGREALGRIKELEAEVGAARQVIDGSEEVRQQILELLGLVAVTIWGPAKVGERHPLADLPKAIAELKAAAPAGGLILPGRTNGHDLGVDRQLYDLRRGIVDRDQRITGMEFGLRTACAQRDRYKDDLDKKSEELASALELVEKWKKRAGQHGCDVEKGDPDCG